MKNSKLITSLFSILMLVTMIACQDTLPQRSISTPAQTIGDDDVEDDEPVEITRPTNDIK